MSTSPETQINARSPAQVRTIPDSADPKFKGLEGAERVSYFARNAVGFTVSDQTNAVGVTTLVNKTLDWLSGWNPFTFADAQEVAKDAPTGGAGARFANAFEEAAMKTAQEAAAKTAQEAAAKTAQEAAAKTAQEAAAKTAQEAAAKTAQEAAAKTAQEAAAKTAQEAAAKTAQEAAAKAAQETATKATEETAGQCVGEACGATSEVLNTSIANATENAAKKAAENATKTSAWFESFTPWQSTKDAASGTANFAYGVGDSIWKSKFRIGVAVVWGLTHSKVAEKAAEWFPKANPTNRNAMSFVFSGVAVWTAINSVWYASTFASEEPIGGIGYQEMVNMGISTIVFEKLYNLAGKGYHAFMKKQVPAKWASLPSWKLSYPIMSNSSVAKKLF